jgi:hypothetical protein
MQVHARAPLSPIYRCWLGCAIMARRAWSIARRSRLASRARRREPQVDDRLRALIDRMEREATPAVGVQNDFAP